jgi:hypothetical protein
MKQLSAQLTTQLQNTFTSGQQAQALANVQGQWSSLISSNSAAASLYGQMLSSIGTMMNNQNLGPNQAASGVSALITQMNSALTVMNEIQGGSLPITKEAPTASGTTPAGTETTTPVTSNTTTKAGAVTTPTTTGTAAKNPLLSGQPNLPAFGL